MSKHDIIVLKLGGSVLSNEAKLPLAIHEVYRWVADGYRVIVVVSALGGATDRLVAAARTTGDEPDEGTTAALIATGELHSAPLVALHLHRAGVPASVCDVDKLQISATGPLLDAEPVSIDIAAIINELARVPVIVVPGFLARDQQRRLVTLGRGGSDLTAIFIGGKLDVPVRLVKDVPGLFERDPKLANTTGGQAPRLYRRIGFDAALQLDGRIVQHKAIRFAKALGMGFEVAGLNAPCGTFVGDCEVEFEAATRSAIAGPGGSASSALLLRPALKVGMLGLGVVGGGVQQAIARQPERFVLTSACVRDKAKYIAAGIDAAALTDSADAVIDGPAEVIVEATGQLESTKDMLVKAIKAGKHVITANKQIIARWGSELFALADEYGVVLQCSAAVGGSVPVLEAIGAIVRSGGTIIQVSGVLNGTCNFVLDRLIAGDTFPDAVKAAQVKGFAEPDPTADLSGQDVACKLCVLALLATGRSLPLGDVECCGIENIDAADVRALAERGRIVRLVGLLMLGNDGSIKASVRPDDFAVSHPLARVKNESNAISIDYRDQYGVMRSRTVFGKGAGRWPTTESIMGDLLRMRRILAERAVSVSNDEPAPAAWLRNGVGSIHHGGHHRPISATNPAARRPASH